MSLVLPSLWITPVKISISGLMYITGVTVTGVTFLMDNTSEDQYIRVLCIFTGVTFLMDNTSEDQYIRSYVCHWCYCHWGYLPYG